MTEERAYPLQIRGDLSPELSRWLWLVKWLLAIPHFIILILMSIAAFSSGLSRGGRYSSPAATPASSSTSSSA